MTAVLDFDVNQYLGSEEVKIEFLFGQKLSRKGDTRPRTFLSNNWKYFGFLKCGNEYPGNKKQVFCDICWKNGVPWAWVIDLLSKIQHESVFNWYFSIHFSYPFPTSSTNVVIFHLRDKHNIYTKHYTKNYKNHKLHKEESKRRIPNDSTDEEAANIPEPNYEEELTDSIVEFLKANNLPADIIENRSFQEILKCAGIRHQTKRPKLSRNQTRRRYRQDYGERSLDEDDRKLIKREDATFIEVCPDLKLESSSSDEQSRQNHNPTKAKKIDNALSQFLIASSLPFKIIDSKVFANFIKELNPQYKIPKSCYLQEKTLKKLCNSSVWSNSKWIYIFLKS